MRKYKKFIPQQVANHNRAASILQALQFQKVRINKYNDLTEGIYTGKITGTTCTCRTARQIRSSA